jgi:hypothetical protein
MSMKSFQRGVALALAISGSAIGAAAQTPSPRPLPEVELNDLRGGYLSAAGIVFDFGAVVRTYIDGRMALESRLTWTEAGALTSHTPGVGLSDAALAGVDLAGLDLSGLDGGQGLILSNGQGATALIHQLDGGRIQNLIVNNADGRDFRQEIEIDLALPQLDMIQGAAGIDRLGAQINQDLNASIIRSLGGN